MKLVDIGEAKKALKADKRKPFKAKPEHPEYAQLYTEKGGR